MRFPRVLAASVLSASFVLTSCTTEAENTESASAEATTTSPTTVEAAESSSATSAEEDGNFDTAEEWLMSMFTNEGSWSAVRERHPDQWAGYVTSTEIKGNVWHIRLDKDADADKKMGNDAATEVALLVAGADHPTTKDITEIIVEDRNGKEMGYWKVPGK